MSERKCIFCPRRITACFGFVVAGDVVDYMNGKREEWPREVCCVCVLIHEPEDIYSLANEGG